MRPEDVGQKGQLGYAWFKPLMWEDFYLEGPELVQLIY